MSKSTPENQEKARSDDPEIKPAKTANKDAVGAQVQSQEGKETDEVVEGKAST